MAVVYVTALLLLIVTLAVQLQLQPADAAPSGGGTPQSSITSGVSFTGCQKQRCTSHNSTRELPMNIALSLPDESNEFEVTVTSIANQSYTASMTLESYEDHGISDKDVQFNIVRLTSSVSSSAIPSQFMALPSNAWVSLSISEIEGDQLVFVVHSGTTKKRGDREVAQGDIFVQGIVVVANWLAKQKVRLIINCHDDDVQVDLNCLRNTNESHLISPSPSPSLDARSERKAVGPQNNYSSTPEVATTTGVYPAPAVVLTVTACGLLILILALLFGLWHWQRRKLHQRRNSYQHQVLKRQTEGASFRRNQQSQTLNLRLSDIEDQEQFQQLRPPAPARKPRTFVKVTRKDSQGNQLPTTTDASFCPDVEDSEPTVYANLPPPDTTSVSLPRPPPRGIVASNVPFQGTSNTRETVPRPLDAGGDCEARTKAANPTVPDNNLLRSLSDEGGMTGPYWFHSTRKPDSETALKIYRV